MILYLDNFWYTNRKNQNTMIFYSLPLPEGGRGGGRSDPVYSKSSRHEEFGCDQGLGGWTIIKPVRTASRRASSFRSAVLSMQSVTLFDVCRILFWKWTAWISNGGASKSPEEYCGVEQWQLIRLIKFLDFSQSGVILMMWREFCTHFAHRLNTKAVDFPVFDINRGSFKTTKAAWKNKTFLLQLP